MLDVAAGKLDPWSNARMVELRQLRLEEVGELEVRKRLGTFDLVFSNFDGLNCIADPGIVLANLAGLLNPNGTAMFVFMGRRPIVEVLANLLRGRIDRSAARAGKEPVRVHIGNDIFFNTYFHTIAALRTSLDPQLRIVAVRAIGLALPPTSMRGLYDRHAWWFNVCESLSRPLRNVPPFNRLGDHLLVKIKWRRDRR